MIELHIYNVDVVGQKFDIVDIITTYQDLKWYERKNGIGGLSFSMDIFDPRATLENLARYKSVIALIEDGQKVLWVGHVVDPRHSYSGHEGKWDISCLSYFDKLNGKKMQGITQEVQKDAGLIAWGMINNRQIAAYGWAGFTQGTIVSSYTIDETVEEGAVVGDKIITMANRTRKGFVFELRPTLNSNHRLDKIYFDVFKTRGIERSDLPILSYENRNLKSHALGTQGNITNYIRSFGSGTGEERLSYFYQDSDSMKRYCRREDMITYQDVSIKDTLVENTVRDLYKSAIERYTLQLELMPNTRPFYGDFICGDILGYDIRIINNSEREIQRITGKGEVTEIAVNVDKNGVKSIVPKLEIVQNIPDVKILRGWSLDRTTEFKKELIAANPWKSTI